MAKVTFHSDGFEGFRRRVLEHARALDRGEPIRTETTLSFESPSEMFRVLSPKRLDLLQTLASKGGRPVEDLAKELGRTGLSVSRDVGILKRLGAVSTTRRGTDEAKGKVIVEAVAARFTFVSSIGR